MSEILNNKSSKVNMKKYTFLIEENHKQIIIKPKIEQKEHPGFFCFSLFKGTFQHKHMLVLNQV